MESVMTSLISTFLSGKHLTPASTLLIGLCLLPTSKNYAVEISQQMSGNIPSQQISAPWNLISSKYTGERVHLKLFYDWVWDNNDPDRNFAGFRPADYNIYVAKRTGVDWKNEIQYQKQRKATDSDTNWGANKEHHRPFNVTSSGKIVGLYMGEWGVWERAFPAELIAANNITHLFYSFAAICDYDRPDATKNDGLNREFSPDGGVSRSWKVMRASCGKGLAPDVNNNERGDLVKLGVVERNGDFEVSEYDYIAVPHSVAAIKKIKQRFPHLKAMLSIGGWTLSDPFYDMVTKPEWRQTFVESVIAFIARHDNVFDGVDIDWEFPGGSGLSPDLTKGYVQDRENFTALIKLLRTRLTAEYGADFELSAALSASPAKLAAVDLNALRDEFTFINLMTYDLYGAWAKDPSHHAAINAKPVMATYNSLSGLATDELGNPVLFNGKTRTNSEVARGFSTRGAIETVRSLYPDFPTNKLVIGVASYSRGWEYLKNKKAYGKFFWHGQAQNWRNSRGSGLGAAGTFQFGVSDFRDIYDHFMKGNTSYLYYDTQAESAYIWKPHTINDATYQFAKVETFDSPRSVIAKGELVKEYNLAGLFMWEAQTDNGLILNAMNAAVCNPLKSGGFYQFSQHYAGESNTVVTQWDKNGTPAAVEESMSSPSTYSFNGAEFCK